MDEEEKKEEPENDHAPDPLAAMQAQIDSLESQVHSLTENVQSLSQKILDTIIPEPEEKESVLDDVFDDTNIERKPEVTKPKRRGLAF